MFVVHLLTFGAAITFATCCFSAPGYWTVRPSPTDHNLHGVTHGNNRYVAVGVDGAILTSPNGASWTLVPHNAGGNNRYAVTFGQMPGYRFLSQAATATHCCPSRRTGPTGPTAWPPSAGNIFGDWPLARISSPRRSALWESELVVGSTEASLRGPSRPPTDLI